MFFAFKNLLFHFWQFWYALITFLRLKYIFLSCHLAREGSLQQALALPKQREGQGKARILPFSHQLYLWGRSNYFFLVKHHMHLKVGELAIIEIYLLQKQNQQHWPRHTRHHHGQELKGEKKIDSEHPEQKNQDGRPKSICPSQRKPSECPSHIQACL